MSGQRYSDADLVRAVAESRSWRGVMRHLGLNPASPWSTRSVRQRAARLDLDTSHFTGQRRWSEDELAGAVAGSRSWSQVQATLGLSGGGSANALKGHAARLGIDSSHLDRTPLRRPPGTPALSPSLVNLPKAGAMLAASWLTLCDFEVAWPLEPCRYDLLASRGSEVTRVQVKTTRSRRDGSWVVSLDSTTGSRRCYAPDEIDAFFVIDAELTYYLIPVAVVGGRYTINLSAYAAFRLDPDLDSTRESGLSPPEPSSGRP